MKKVLGIDTGTNSLGWAIVEKDFDKTLLLEKGVNIFQEGVKIEKGNESSKAAERTMHRATRVRYYRIKLRKIRLLRILSDNHLCPPLTSTELSDWRLKKYIRKMNCLCVGKARMTMLIKIHILIDIDVSMKNWT